MRNERPWVANAEHSAAPSLNAASSRDGSTPPRTDGPAGTTRDGASIDAQILQMLRTRLRTTGSLEAAAGEIRRLGTVAAAIHRASACGRSAGTSLALGIQTAADGRGLDQSEDAA